MKIQVKEQAIELKFSFALLLMLAKLWNEKHIEAVINRLAVAVDENNQGTPVQLFYDVIDIVRCAAKMSGNEIDATDEELIDIIFADMQIVTDIVTNLTESLPKPKADVDPSARKK